MSNQVTVSCVSGPPVQAVRGERWAAVLDRVASVWRDRLDQVLPDRPDIIVLPEACDRPVAVGPGDGFSPEERAEYYAARGDVMRDLFAEVAAANRCHIAYSAARHDAEGRWWNSTQLIGRDGRVVGVYDKNHPTIGEHDRYGMGYSDAAPVFDLDFGRVAAAICFDLNFDDLQEKYVAARPDLVVFSSAYHGGIVQNQWAYSTRAYFASAIAPPCPSSVISPVGQEVATSTNYRNYVTTEINLDRAIVHLDYNRPRLKAMKDKYGPGVQIHDPGRLGAVLVTVETDEVTAADVVAEFELELLDDYFARARAHRAAHLGDS